MFNRIMLMWLKVRIRKTQYRLEDEVQSRRVALQMTKLRISRAKQLHVEALNRHTELRARVECRESVVSLISGKIRKIVVPYLV